MVFSFFINKPGEEKKMEQLSLKHERKNGRDGFNENHVASKICVRFLNI